MLPQQPLCIFGFRKRLHTNIITLFTATIYTFLSVKQSKYHVLSTLFRSDRNEPDKRTKEEGEEPGYRIAENQGFCIDIAGIDVGESDVRFSSSKFL